MKQKKEYEWHGLERFHVIHEIDLFQAFRHGQIKEIIPRYIRETQDEARQEKTAELNDLKPVPRYIIVVLAFLLAKNKG